MAVGVVIILFSTVIVGKGVAKNLPDFGVIDLKKRHNKPIYLNWRSNRIC